MPLSPARIKVAFHAIFAMVFVVAFTGAAFMFMIDLAAALNHWSIGVGDPVAAAVAHGMEWSMDKLFAFIALVFIFLYHTSINTLMFLGASERTATVITVLIGLALDLVVLFFLVRYQWRSYWRDQTK